VGLEGFRGRARQAGIELPVRLAHVWKLRHGVALVRQLRCYGESPACWSARRAGSTGLVPEPAEPGNAGGRLRPLGLDAPAPPPSRRPDQAGTPAVTGPLAPRRQRRRRRITPNTTTSTTTMISTHNHVDMAASLVDAGQLKLTLLPPTRASNSVTTSQPSPNHRTQHHTSGGPGRRHPTRRDHSGPDHSEPDRRVGPGRAAFALLGRGNNASMAVLMRNGRRRAAGAGPMVRAFGETRTCAEDGCTTRLSRYNPARRCAIHQGWDQQETTRTRQHRI